MTALYPSPDDIAAATSRIAGHVRVTPILDLEAEAMGLGYPVTVKLEQTQITGSFKVRGAFNNMLSRDVPAGGVIAMSGGNHGAAVAYAATKLGHRSKIYVPALIAKEEKLRRMRAFGGEVILTEGSVAECVAEYARLGADPSVLSVHPYDTPWTLAGQGTVAREMEAQMGGLDTVLVATGGGGFIGGVASYFGDRVKVVSVETETTNTLALSLEKGPDIEVQPSGIAAGSLGGPSLGVVPYAVVKDRVKDAVLVSDDAVMEAAERLWTATRIVAEPGGVVALAALTSGAYVPEKGERVGVLLCGGNEALGWFNA